MIQKTIDKEKGQSLVLLALMLLGMIAMLALVLDGGNVFARRRLAQNAADAGALAGARALCVDDSASLALTMAQQYALANDPTVSPAVSVDTVNRSVAVTATATFNSFFAHMIGLPLLSAQASAEVACLNPTTGESVLPVAWACKPPISQALSSSPDCQEQWIDPQTTLPYYINNPPPPGTIYPELYIIMNSQSLPTDLAAICISAGGWLDCDLDDDGDDDLQANGDRSWLDLDGSGGGASQLNDWILNGFPGSIDTHTWLGGQPGVANTIFQTVGDIEGLLAMIPVFDRFCDGYPSSDCPSQFDTGDLIIDSAGGNYYYRIIGFARFYIACVNAPGVHHGECPGHKVATDLGVIAHNVATIEGYFIGPGIIPGFGGGGGSGGVNLGSYVLKLVR